MCKEAFSKRLVQLRMAKGVSASYMSLSLGQNPGYINSIENNKTFPSMSNFFEICDYLNITPMEFFDLESAHPEKIRTLTEQLKRLDAAQLDSILRIVNGLVSNHPYLFFAIHKSVKTPSFAGHKKKIQDFLLYLSF